MPVPLPLGSACAVCGQALPSPSAIVADRTAPSEEWSPLCGQPACVVRRRQQLEMARERRRRQTLREQAEALQAQMPAPSQPRERFPLAMIPALERDLVANTPERRAALRRNLGKALGAAVVQMRRDGEPVPGPPALPPLSTAATATLAAACALCRGHCCTRGGDHAYLTAEVMSRRLSERPGERPADLLNDYLRRLPDEHVAGSCIYHGAHGCTLPTTLRSETCNRFFCPELRGLVSRFQAETSCQAFFVAVNDDDLIVRASYAGAVTGPVAGEAMEPLVRRRAAVSMRSESRRGGATVAGPRRKVEDDSCSASVARNVPSHSD